MSGVIDPSSRLVADACFSATPRRSVLEALGERQLARDRLWQSGFHVFESDDAVRLWQSGRYLQSVTGPPWRVPANPDWSEDPYRNRSWLTRYHSLAWLAAPARAYREGDTAAGEAVGRYVLDWIADNPRADPPSPRSWYDGSVRRRTDSIVALWDVLSATLSPGDLATVLSSLHLHGKVLHGYLSEPRFVGHNHNLFHALSLFSLGAAFPELEGSAAWRRDARARIASLLGEMVNSVDGVSTEQAAVYHGLAMRLFTAAERFLNAHDQEIPGLEEALERMTLFAAMLLDPTGLLPAIGDTRFGVSGATTRRILERMAEAGVASAEAEFVLTEGAEGARPPDARFFGGEGYAIFRPSYGEAGPWVDDVHVVVDMGLGRRVHGHDDAMNLLLTAYGRQLLIDSGGPYAYGNPLRQNFVGAMAHNTVVVDRRGYGPGDAQILDTADSESYSLIAGSHRNTPGITHRRAVLLIKPSIVVVLDWLIPDGGVHRFDLLYHLPPDAEIDTEGSSARVRAGPAGLGVAVEASGSVDLSVHAGEAGGLGWVTSSNAARTPAPVLDFGLSGAESWFVTAILPSPSDAVSVPDLRVQGRGSGLQIELATAGGRWLVEAGDDGRIEVREVR